MYFAAALVGPKLEMFRQLRPIFRKIDSKIVELLGIEVDALWDQAWGMMERGVKGAGRVARPGALPMAEEKPRGRGGRRRRGGGSASITSFL